MIHALIESVHGNNRLHRVVRNEESTRKKSAAQAFLLHHQDNEEEDIGADYTQHSGLYFVSGV